DGELFPARADYGMNGQWQIGNNPLSVDRSLWFPLADVVAAAIRSRRTPRIVRAVRLSPTGRQDALTPGRLRGGVGIDPSYQDYVGTVVEQGRVVSRTTVRDPAERDRLRAFLKVLANSGCYGIFAELNETQLGARGQPATIYGLRAFDRPLRAIEEPG